MPDSNTAQKLAPAPLLTSCRACKAPDPYLFLPLGNHAPAQMLIRPDELDRDQPAFALNTQVCLECGLIEIADQIPADFFRHYLYVPSGAARMHTHFGDFAKVLADLAGEGLIVDIGSNDGLLLAACNKLGCTTLGFDPAENIAALAAENGVETFIAYFTPKTARQVLDERGPAQVIVTTNTFNHIGDLHGFMEAIDVLLAPDGTFVIEVPRAKEYIEHTEFDNIYHEHVSEFSLLSIARLADSFGLQVIDALSLPDIHGGSMRVFLARRESGRVPGDRVAAMFAEEIGAGMLERQTYDDITSRVTEIGRQTRAMLDELKAQGLKVAGYGASARGNTLITHFGIETKYLAFLVDKNPLKQGLYSPNTRIPIKPVSAIEEEAPDVLFVLAWNFFDEIFEQQAAFRARGGKFLVPLPYPRLI
ncbi:class I SAM-dependent methyltransferase [Novosphingobium profundi]|uniref:class I SAM-dependent methyltransferase n=1 Tax=Novosphingobium profundi TaxID=1774954 RepID=UPI001BD91816|nr:class I SAM-dependent methyltransferase [Novosphingobium profundi]MBT0667207.1 class I SAM-dependent methyltransferase [Novosphingobium profundi]